MSTSTTTKPAKFNLGKVIPLAALEPVSARYLELPLSTDLPLIPDVSSTDYRTISRKTVYHADIFNCTYKKYLQEVIVSGMRLVWDDNGDKLLLALNNQQDFKRVTIVADTVQINMPLRFPQAEVLIFARELIFTERGSINITPLIRHEVPEPDMKIATEHGFSGKPGERGAHCQSLILNVRKICFPEPSGEEDQFTTRIIARGADGQAGGDGGLLEQTGTPVPPAVSWKSFYDKIMNTYLATIPFGIPLYVWNHPGPGWPIVKGAPHLETELLEQQPGKLNNVHMLHLDATVHFPGGYFYLTNWNISLGNKTPLPANGRNAYPSGRPGDGGKGGQVYFSGQLDYLDKNRNFDLFDTTASPTGCNKCIEDITDVSGGKAGTAKDMQGGEPALKNTAAYVKLEVKFNYVAKGKLTRPSKWDKLIPKRKRTALYDGHVEDADIKFEDKSPRRGLDAPAPKASAGEAGLILAQDERAAIWLHEFNTEAALNYAKHASLAHNRDLARQVAKTYLDAFEASTQPLSPQLAALQSEFKTLMQRLDTDLDIYGNQLGWVPHLSVLGTYSNFQLLVKQAFNTMFLCYKMKNQWQEMENNLDCFSATRKAVLQQLVNARQDLANYQQEYSRLQTELQQQLNASARLQGELETVVEHIKVEAEIDEKNKAVQLGGIKITFGSLKLISGGLGILSQVIPVGQPYLGVIGGTGTKVAGGVFSTVEGLLTSVMDLETADSVDSGNAVMKQAGKLLNQHQDTIAKVASKPFTKKLNADLSDTQKQLAEIGNTTRELAADKNELKLLLDLPEDKITEQLERLLRLEGDKSSSSAQEVAQKMREVIQQRITQLEQATTSYKDTIASLRSKSKQADALAGKAAGLASQKQKTEAKLKLTVQGLSKMTGDVQDVFDGVRALCFRKQDLEPKIAAQIEKLKETVFGEKLTSLHEKISAANLNKEETMRRMERCHMAIQTAAVNIEQCLEQVDAIDHRILGLSGALDHSVYSFLVSLDNEARATVTKQLYYFAKSYQYRFLKKVKPEFYKLDKFIDKLATFMETDPAGSNVRLDKEAFADIYQLLQDRLSSQIHFLTDDVQHNRLAKKTPWLIHARELMDEAALQKLNTPLSDQKGKIVNYEPVVINFVKAGYALPNAIKLRVADVILKSVSLDNVEQFKHGLNFGMRFVHSGTSILYDGDDYYLFRAQNPAEKISWEFTVNINSRGRVEIKPVTVSTMDIELLQKLSGSDTKVSDLLAAYSPSGSSDITLYRTDSGGAKGSVITDFVLEVTLEEFKDSG